MWIRDSTVQSLWPVPERAIGEALAGITRVVVAELNHGQYLSLIHISEPTRPY